MPEGQLLNVPTSVINEGTSRARTMNTSIRMPTASRKPSSRNGASGTSASSPKLAASARPAEVIARVDSGVATRSASFIERSRASCQTWPTAKML